MFTRYRKTEITFKSITKKGFVSKNSMFKLSLKR